MDGEKKRPSDIVVVSGRYYGLGDFLRWMRTLVRPSSSDMDEGMEGVSLPDHYSVYVTYDTIPPLDELRNTFGPDNVSAIVEHILRLCSTWVLVIVHSLAVNGVYC